MADFRCGEEIYISIHAPARGATRTAPMQTMPWAFQSTLPHGERQFVPSPDAYWEAFQSTLPHGERPERQLARPGGRAISIHAPARGATPDGQRAGADGRNFNPRSRTGSDAGARAYQPKVVDFNPRSRTGSDAQRNGAADDSDAISIHAPARGATCLPV